MNSPFKAESFRLHTDDGLVIIAAFDDKGVGALALLDGPSIGPVLLAQVPDAIKALEAFAGFEGELHKASWVSCGWDTGRLVLEVARWLDVSAEFDVDGEIWESDSVGGCLPLDRDQIVGELDRISWDLGPGSGGSPGNNDDGIDVLAKMGGRYLVFSFSGGERSVSDDIKAESDDAAIAEFRRLYTVEFVDEPE